MQRILFSLDSLGRCTAAESMTLRLAGWFLRHGWSVDIVARLIDGEVRRLLTGLSDSGSLRLITDDDDLLPAEVMPEYHLIWICNGYLAGGLLRRLTRGQIRGRCLFQHFSAAMDHTGYHQSTLENNLAWRIVTDSPLNYAAQCLRGLSAPAMRLLPMAFDEDGTQPQPPVAGELKKILWQTESLTPQLSELTTLCSLRGICLDVFVTSFQPPVMTNQQLSDYQLVVGEEQLVARALCLGIPVCIAGKAGWQGYLTEQSLAVAGDSFFIATHGKMPDSQHCLQVLLDGYPQAQQWALAHQSRAAENWSLSSLVPQILDELPVPVPLSIPAAQAEEWRLSRNILAQQAEARQPLMEWLKHRQISDTRRAVLLSVIRAQPDNAGIGVIIMDRQQDRQACEQTLLSLRQQSLAAQQCILVSGQDYPCLLTEAEISLVMSPGGQALRQASERFTAHSWLVIDAGTRCLKDSLLLFAVYQLEHPDSQLCYSDMLQGTSPQEARLILRPQCNIDLLRSRHYPGEQMLVTDSCLKNSLPAQPLYDDLLFSELTWRVIESAGPAAVGHLPEALLLVAEQQTTMLPDNRYRQIIAQHLQRCGSDGWSEAGAPGMPDRLRYPLPVSACVSIIIVTRDNQPLLRRCLDSLTEHTGWPDYELLIVDNDSQQPDACDYLNQLQALKLRNLKILRNSCAFNFAAINNFAATHARGDYLLFLNNDCLFSEAGWLNAMLEIAHRPEVAVTGARQLYADGRLQHAGFITGIEPARASAFQGEASSSPGFSHYLQTAHEVSAVSASCMLVRRTVFESAGGFDAEHFSGGSADIDLCLRIRRQGYLVIWTPEATLQHMGGATRLSAAYYAAASQAEQQGLEALRLRWKDQLCRDIRYHRHFSRTGQPFTLSHRTSRLQQPLPGRPLPVMVAGHVNYTGCGNYRVIQPYQLMEQQLQLEGGLIHGLPAAMDIASLQPDIVLLQMPFDPQIEETLRHYRQLCPAKIIMEYDDYFVNLPVKNHNRLKLPKDIVSRLKRTTAQADHLVVSTEALASAYQGFHSDIRVALNRLAPQLWGELCAVRRQGNKPRIGWAGGNSHEGDLAIIRPLADALGDEVEWVFMGMKPDIASCEFHRGVPFDWYPQKLASLGLDLALVPLEINLFNECKSNLRLLELGACGIPVICSDIEPYRGTLPVIRVKNTFRHWLKAIREQLADRQALARQGDALQQAVRRDWMLTPDALAEWQKAWLA